MKESRLGIPILFGEECSHGHMAIGATVFPVPLALGSMWNPGLYREMCRAVALETRSQGGAATYSPVLDVVRDPRWGRTEETFGEDPFLIAAMGVEAVKGLQGERLDAEDAVLATLKHFAAYGSSEGGRNSAPVHMGLRELHEVDLLPFRKAVEAGALSIMTAYNEIDGVPCTTNRYLLQDVLREQWGFDGFVITDCGALGGRPDSVLYAPGCRIKGDSREGFAHALACAADADAVVMAIGGSSARDFGEGTIDLLTGASVVTEHSWNDMECGEGIDRATLNLTGVQLELVQEVHKLGKPLIVVYINGRPIAEPWIVEHADAILEAWYPGQEGGHAIADILFGEVNPSGCLTISIPKHAGQLPVYYYKRRTRGKRYLETDFNAEYPFGYGLSFSEFKYSNLRVEPAVISVDGEARVSVDVTNSSTRTGSEVVQLYISDLASSITRPESSLRPSARSASSRETRRRLRSASAGSRWNTYRQIYRGLWRRENSR